MTDIVAGSRIIKSDDCVETEVDGETVLMHAGTGRFFSLEATGQRAWNLLETTDTFDGVVKAMLAEFTVDEATCKMDLGELFLALEDREIVSIKNA